MNPAREGPARVPLSLFPLLSAALGLAACVAALPPEGGGGPGIPATPAAPPAAERPAPAPPEICSPRRTVEIPLDAKRAGPGRRAELWTTLDGGANWLNQGVVDLSGGAVTFLAPRDGRYGYLLVPLGPEGVRTFTPKPGDPPEGSLLVDTQPPVVELLAPNGGELFGAGKTTIIRWVARDAHLAPGGIALEACPDGTTWVALARDLPNTGSYSWDIGPLSGSRFRIRVTAADLAGNTAADESDAPFVVDGLPPDVRITGPLVARDLPARLEWTGGDLGGAGLARVRLYVSGDNGQTWKYHGEDEDLRSPFLFQELDGLYGLFLAGEDRVGNANPVPSPGTRPQFTLIVDRTPPEVKILAPQGGGYLGGIPVDVRWMARDNIGLDPYPVLLHYSDDDGQTWKEVARGLKNDGFFSWTPPRTPGTRCRFRVTAVDAAGNEGRAVSERFGIDAAIPEAVALGPDRSGSHTVSIDYEIRNRGSAPIRSVRLYYRPEGAREWLEYGEDPDATSPFPFAKADGRYGLFLTCATESGLRAGAVQRPPGPDSAPQLVLTIDATPPILTLETMNGGGFFMAGSLVSVAWKMVEPNPDPAGLSLYHTPDGGFNWNLVASNLDPAKGAYSWIVPKSPGARHRLRLVALDRFGNRGQAESERPFTIDDEPPTVLVTKRPPEVLRSPRLSVEYRASDLLSGIERVQLYGRPQGIEGPYKLLQESRNPQGTLESEIPGEGAWGFLLVAVDGAGFVSADVGKNPKPEFTCSLDVTRPSLALRKGMLPQGKVTWLNPSWEIEWTAEDRIAPPDRLAVRIEYSSDGGRTWFVAVPRHPNTGRADLRNFLVPGKKYRIRAVAIDPAGNEGEDVTEDFDPGDLPAPSLALRGIEEGKAYPAGDFLSISWSSADPGIRAVTLELSRDGGRTWTALSEVRSPTVRFPVPGQAGRYHLRAVSSDALRRPVCSNSLGFEVVPAAGAVRISASPVAEASGRVRVLLEPPAAAEAARSIRLEISDGGAWTRVAEARGAEVQFPAPAVPGEYAVRARVAAADGGEQVTNEARFRVVAPGTSPGGVRLLNFQKGGVFAGGRMQLILVRSEEGTAGLRVELSDAGGRDGTWKEIPPEQLRAEKDAFQWRVPAVTGRSYRLRVGRRDASGRWTGDASAVDFAIDSTPPRAVVQGPRGETSAPVRLEVRLEPSISPIRQLTLYVTRDGGRTWVQHGVYGAEEGIEFHPPVAGDYGVYVAARSEAGLAGDAPTEGTPPQAVIRVRGKVEPPPPAAGPLRLDRALGEVLRGGTRVELSWTSEGTGPVEISWIVGGEKKAIAKDRPPRGTCTWEVPARDLGRCRIVLEQEGKVWTSPEFDIDSSPPEVRDADVEVPAK